MYYAYRPMYIIIKTTHNQLYNYIYNLLTQNQLRAKYEVIARLYRILIYICTLYS